MEDQVRMKPMEATTATTTTTIINRISSSRRTTTQQKGNTMQVQMSIATAMAASIAEFEQRRTDMTTDSDTCAGNCSSNRNLKFNIIKTVKKK